MVLIRSKIVVHVLRLLWICFILNNEYFVYWFSASKCNSMSTSLTDGKLMLIGDPQITDDHSYQRNGFFMAITKFVSSQYMRRNYRQLINTIRPTDIFFLGDLMDSGRDWDDAFYAKEVERFHTIFPDHHIPTYYLAGNHDLGFGNGVTRERQVRFKSHFGPASYRFEKYGHEFIVLDTVSLSSDDPEIRKEAVQVLDSEGMDMPRVLLTHVPLYRTQQQTCGPNRQSKSNIIREGAGYQYQNLVSKDISEYILSKINPVTVFSGDDHDYCKVTHQQGAMEITVPTLSMAQGVRRPGLVILNIQEQVTTDLCWLPDQIGIYIQYGCFMLFTIAVLVIFNLFKWLPTKNYDLLANEERGLASIEPVSWSFKRFMLSTLYSIRDVAWVALLFYIVCIIII